jgi:hypothetical protein
MAASVGALTHAVRPRLAKGYRYLYDDRPPHAGQPLFPATWIEVSSGDCSIASTAEDMAKFGRMLLNRGQGVDSQVLAPASYAAMVQAQSSAGWCDYGYGIMLRTYEDFAHIGHGGGMPGYVAELIIDVDHGVGLSLLSSEPHPAGLFWRLMTLWRKIYLGQPLVPVDLSMPDPDVVKNAAEYAGIYRSEAKTLTITAEGEQLQLRHEGQAIVLESGESDRFYSHHPDFDRFLLQFGRAKGINGAPGEVVEAMHGADWYVKDSYSGQRTFEVPVAWQMVPGHYRSHNPWQTNFRVILRKGELLLVEPGGDEQRLFPTREHEFCIGDEAAPERICFSQFVGENALCATRSGCEYYRFFTP